MLSYTTPCALLLDGFDSYPCLTFVILLFCINHNKTILKRYINRIYTYNIRFIYGIYTVYKRFIQKNGIIEV